MKTYILAKATSISQEGPGWAYIVLSEIVVNLRTSIIAIYLLVSFGFAWSTLSAQSGHFDADVDARVRQYLTAQRIVWQSDTNHIIDATNLLSRGNGQADLVGKNLCILMGNRELTPSILLDFGRELHGGIQVVSGMFEGKDPVRIKITLGESVSEAMSRVGQSTATNDHAMREFELEVPWLGKVEVGNSGFRFARIDLLDVDRVLKIKEIRAISIFRDIPYVGSFRCSDTLLNRIWHTGAYTVHLNMQEFLWDGIKRDRLVWVGDMHPEIMTILSVFGDNEVVPKSLDLIRDITDLPHWMNGISAYSMWWILIHHEWYMHTGDLPYLRKNLDYMFALLDALQEKVDENGMESLDGTRFLDWPTSPNEAAIHAGLQSLMIMSFQKGVDIAKLFGVVARAEDYQHTLTRLMSHIPDPNQNKSAAALLALSGLQEAEHINAKYLSIDPYKDISTFYGYYVLEARALAGDYAAAMDLIREYWGAMIQLGATTFWEDFDLAWMKDAARIDQLTPQGKVDVHATYGDYCYVGLRHSLCHGWASGPTAWLSRHVLGVKVIEPGCKRVEIQPNLGDLGWVEGTYPTPLGPIKIKHVRIGDGSIESSIQAPEGVEVLVK